MASRPLGFRSQLAIANSAFLTGEELMGLNDVINEHGEQGDRGFEMVTFVTAKYFQRDFERTTSAYFRMTALLEILQDPGFLAGWTRNGTRPGEVMAHPAIFAAAGRAPLYANGDGLSFRRQTFLRAAFQCAKELGEED
jgi:hypothetical protein